MTKHAHSPPTSGHAGATVRRALLFGLGLLALLAATHPDALFGGKIYGSVDASNSDAFTLVGDSARQAGDYPEWNPYLFGGMPTFGSQAYTWGIYPPTLLMNWLQDDLGLPPLTWMLLHLVFGGAGVIWLLGRWRLPASARLLGAAFWLLFPRVVAWGVHGHGSKLVAAMYLPWLLGLALEALDGRGRRVAGGAALLLGLVILRGHPQITYYTLLALGVILVAAWIRWALRRRELSPPVGATAWGSAAVAAGLLIGAVCLLPVHEYAPWSVRGASAGGGAAYDYATGWSFSPRELGTLVLPSLSGFGLSTYQGPMPFTDYPNTFGVLALGLAVAAWWDRRRRWATAALWALFGLGLLVSFGKHMPLLYGPMYAALPYFNKLRIPSMILILSAAAVAVLAGLGAARLTSESGPSAARLRTLGWVLVGAAAVALVASLGGGRTAAEAHLTSLAAASGRPAPPSILLAEAWDLLRSDLLRLALVLTAAAGGLLAASRSRTWRARGLGWLLCLLVVVELMGVSGRITHPERSLVRVARDPAGRGVLVDAPSLVRERAATGAIAPRPDLVHLAEALGHERVWPQGRDAQLNDGMIAGVRSLGGYYAAKLAAYETIRGRLYAPGRPAARLASWLGAAMVTSDQPFGAANLAALGRLGAELEPDPAVLGNLYAYRNRSALPRARLVHAWRHPEGEGLEGFLDAVQAGRWDPGRVVTLPEEPHPAPTPAPTDEVPVRFLADGLDEVVLEATPATPAVLVLADMAHPGWEVFVDGEPRPLLLADHVLRGVALEPGRHEIRFVYHDTVLRRSLVLSLVGLAAALLLVVVGLRGRGVDGEERSA